MEVLEKCSQNTIEKKMQRLLIYYLTAPYLSGSFMINSSAGRFTLLLHDRNDDTRFTRQNYWENVALQ